MAILEVSLDPKLLELNFQCKILLPETKYIYPGIFRDILVTSIPVVMKRDDTTPAVHLMKVCCSNVGSSIHTQLDQLFEWRIILFLNNYFERTF